MEWTLAVALKPLLLSFLFLPGAIVMRLARQYLPHGALRRVLLFSWRV